MALINSGTESAARDGALKEYRAVINGHVTTLQLSDEDAKLHGLTESDLVSHPPKAKAVANKQARAPQNKQPQKD